MKAITEIMCGKTILIWGGACYTDKTGALAAKKEGKGTMQWDEDIFSFETDVDEDLFAINHSCDPNSWMSDAFSLVASRNISSGEEITADYALWEIDSNGSSSWTCQCGASSCRGKITGDDWKNPVLQKRYAGHFSPYINKLIAGKVWLEK